MDELLRALYLANRGGGFSPSESIAYARTAKVFAYFEKLGLLHLRAITPTKIITINSNTTYTQLRELVLENAVSVQCSYTHNAYTHYDISIDLYDEPGSIAKYISAMNYLKLSGIYRICA